MEEEEEETSSPRLIRRRLYGSDYQREREKRMTNHPITILVQRRRVRSDATLLLYLHTHYGWGPSVISISE